MDGCMDYSRARLRRIHLFSWRHGARHRELRRPEADSLALCFASQTGDVYKRQACYRYAELGGAYQDEKNECGLSGQYARFQQGSEYSLEVTWKRQLTESISLQPSFQYIKNDNGDFTALSARLYVSF